MKKLFLLLCIAFVIIAGCEKPDIEIPSNTPRTEVPDELVGAWENGTIDFTLWENYPETYYAGRNAIPTREAMIFYKNGDAKFYRYEFGFNMYEELIDCAGTVTFNNDGTFTFYPKTGRKRYFDTRHSENNVDRSMKGNELVHPRIAGKRGYVFNGASNPPVIQITVPGSATYNWYKK